MCAVGISGVVPVPHRGSEIRKSKPLGSTKLLQVLLSVQERFTLLSTAERRPLEVPGSVSLV